MKHGGLCLLILVIFAGCQHKKDAVEKKVSASSFESYELKPQLIQKMPNGDSLIWGGFSALRFIEKESTGDLLFWTLTDRGPNGAEIKKGEKLYRTFLVPDFHPSLVKLRARLQDHALEIVEIIPFKNSSGEFLSGLPPANPAQNPSRFEIPVDAGNQELNNSSVGLDSESLAIDDEKHFWVGEEYEPSILEFDPQGTLLSRIRPAAQAGRKLKKNQLPYEYSFRKANRGFEALAFFKDRIYFMLQSPLEVDTKPQYIRIGVFNKKTRRYEAEYLYPLENMKIDKIGDLEMIDAKHFLVIEQNGQTGPKSAHRIYTVNLTQATNVLKADFKGAPEMTAPYAFPKNFRFAQKTLTLDLVKEGYADYEKVEGLAIVDPSTIAVINDNDFGVDGDKIVTRKTTLGIFKIKN